MDIWPYSQRQDGSVNDIEHEILWSAVGDGILPYQSNALDVSVSGSSYVVQPGRILIAGHVLDVDTVQTDALPAPAGANRKCLVVAYVNHSDSPWTYGIDLLQGTAGGGRPPTFKSRTGLYHVVLREIDVASNGAIDLYPDERPFVNGSGSVPPRTVSNSNNAGDTFAYTSFQTGNSPASVTFVAPPTGRVLVKVAAMARSSGGSGQRAIFGFSVRERNSSGPVVYGPNTYDGPIVESDRFVMGEVETLVSGLSPGRTYYARTAQRSSAGSCTVAHLKLIVSPAT